MTDPDAGSRIASTDGVRLAVIGGDTNRGIADPGALPIVVCWIGDELGGSGPAEADLVVSPNELNYVSDLIASQPHASVTLALLLRQTALLPVELGLAAESSAYSMLQGAAEFARWRGDTAPATDQQPEPTVTVSRDHDVLSVQLNRPHRHNAVTRQMRDELCDALRIALIDDTITSVRLSGNGPSFCSGGDLAEFGTRPDSAQAHITRLAQSPARMIHQLRDKITVDVHGATLGGGLEMAAFAGHIVADRGTHFGLPELPLGLIPGGGGTVSLTRRIGRQRTAALALAVDTIDASIAFRWGLVDQIVECTETSMAVSNDGRIQLG